MGNFLALSAVVGKKHNEVLTSLTNYANSVGGGIQQHNNVTPGNDDCVIEEADGNTTLSYPDGYLEWDDSSKFISRDLNATVFSFHIHDGDLWMYLLYNNGKIIDQFNPIPDYWDDTITGEEMETWKGNASIVAKYFSHLNPKDIESYLVKWNPDEEESTKAYLTDEFTREEWQLLDFMKKLKLPYPFDDNGNPKGQKYKIWTSKLPLEATTKMQTGKAEAKNKPWWKFW